MPELHRETEGNGRDDGHRGRAHRSDRSQHTGDGEHDPRDRAHAAADRPHRQVHQPGDRPIALGDGEQVCDAYQDDEDVAREHAEDVVRGHVGGERADQERGGKCE